MTINPSGNGPAKPDSTAVDGFSSTNKKNIEDLEKVKKKITEHMRAKAELTEYFSKSEKKVDTSKMFENSPAETKESLSKKLHEGEKALIEYYNSLSPEEKNLLNQQYGKDMENKEINKIMGLEINSKPPEEAN